MVDSFIALPSKALYTIREMLKILRNDGATISRKLCSVIQYKVRYPTTLFLPTSMRCDWFHSSS